MERRIIYVGGNGSYERISRIGQGAEGVAYLVKRVNDGREFVAKVNSDHSRFKEAVEEAGQLRRFNSRYIVRYHDSFFRTVEGESNFVLVTEYCNLGDLQKVITTHGGKPENLKLYLRIAKCIVKGLKEMHAKHKFHRDVKPLNIFISGDLSRPMKVYAKLGDFGLVRDVDHSLLIETVNKGSMSYFSPEMMMSNGSGIPSDMWALGVTLFQMVSGLFPFNNHEDLVHGRAKVLPAWVPQGFKRLIAGLLTVDIDKRLTASQANKILN